MRDFLPSLRHCLVPNHMVCSFSMTQGGGSLGRRFQIKHMVSRVAVSTLCVGMGTHGPFPLLWGLFLPPQDGLSQASAGPAAGKGGAAYVGGGAEDPEAAAPLAQAPGASTRSPGASGLGTGPFILKGEARPVPVEAQWGPFLLVTLPGAL